MWLINSHNGIKEKNIPPINIDDYPAVKRHLDQYYDQLEKRQDKGVTPYNLRNCAYLEEFNRQKIVWQRITKEPTFCYSTAGQNILDSMAFLSGFKVEEGNYLLALLNSKLVNYWVSVNVHQYGNSGYRLSNQYVELIPIINNSLYFEYFSNKVQEVEHNIDNSKERFLIESSIDLMIYKLYELSYQEVTLIDPDIKICKEEYNNLTIESIAKLSFSSNP